MRILSICALAALAACTVEEQEPVEGDRYVIRENVPERVDVRFEQREVDVPDQVVIPDVDIVTPRDTDDEAVPPVRRGPPER